MDLPFITRKKIGKDGWVFPRVIKLSGGFYKVKQWSQKDNESVSLGAGGSLIRF